MSVSELRRLSASLGLPVKGSKKELLLAIHAKEEEMINDSDRPGLKRAVEVEVETESVEASVSVGPGTHNGKKIISQTE